MTYGEERRKESRGGRRWERGTKGEEGRCSREV